jgi:putative hydrolase of the HAD superfamily
MTSVIVFDLDDTLYLERDYVRSGFKAVDSYLISRDMEGFFDSAWSYFCAGGRGDTFNKVLAELSFPFDNSFIKELVTVYRDHKPVISLCNDSKTVLEQLNNKVSIGLITDGFSISQHNKIDALKLQNYISKIVVTDDLAANRKYWKPHSKPYEVIKDFFGVKHSDCVYIADNEKKDFITAKKLNWKTICVDRDGKEHKNQNYSDEFKADIYLETLFQLESKL